jgi:hypothetical protein
LRELANNLLPDCSVLAAGSDAILRRKLVEMKSPIVRRAGPIGPAGSIGHSTAAA